MHKDGESVRGSRIDFTWKRILAMTLAFLGRSHESRDLSDGRHVVDSDSDIRGT